MRNWRNRPRLLAMVGPTKNPVVHRVAMFVLVVAWLFGWCIVVWGVTGSSTKLLLQGMVVVVCLGFVLVQGWRRRP